MHFVVRLWLVAFTTLAVAQSRPLVIEEKAVITASEVAYTEFGAAVAIDRPWALITAAVNREPARSGARSEEFQRLPT
jgi:hypothetical protein